MRAYVVYAIPSGLQVFTGSSINARDAQMADNLVWLAEKYHPDRKIIVWAATVHLTRNAAGIEVPDESVNYSGVVPMGISSIKNSAIRSSQLPSPLVVETLSSGLSLLLKSVPLRLEHWKISAQRPA